MGLFNELYNILTKNFALFNYLTLLTQKLKNLNYQDRLVRLELPAMVYRRMSGDVIDMFKIMSHRYEPETNIEFCISDGPARGNSMKIFKPRCTTKLQQQMFLVRLIDVWNSVRSSVVHASSLNAFERKLDKLWENQGIEYEFKEALVLVAISRRGSCCQPESKS